VEIRYTLTVDNYLEASGLWSTNSTFRRKMNYYIGVKFAYVVGTLLVCGGIASLPGGLLGMGNWNAASLADLIRHVSLTGLFLFAFGGYCLISPSLYRDRAYRFFEEAKLRQERAARVDDSGVAITRSDGAAESRMAWSYFDGYVEGPGVFVFFPDGRHFLMLPKQQMSEEQQEELRRLLGAHIPGSGAR
jgi:hypothetical protein